MVSGGSSGGIGSRGLTVREIRLNTASIQARDAAPVTSREEHVVVGSAKLEGRLARRIQPSLEGCLEGLAARPDDTRRVYSVVHVVETCIQGITHIVCHLLA